MGTPDSGGGGLAGAFDDVVLEYSFGALERIRSAQCDNTRPERERSQVVVARAGIPLDQTGAN